MKTQTANELAAQLDLDVDEVGICHACLCVVSFALDKGDEREIRRETNSQTPILWAEGLALPAQLALERARRRGLPHAEAAIADIEARGARSPVPKAIVRRLGADLSAAVAARHQRFFGRDGKAELALAPEGPDLGSAAG